MEPLPRCLYAVIQSIAKLVALGGDRKKVYLTMQEFFQSLGQNETAWGQPVSALLGAFVAQQVMEVAAIGGKDSMSGTFENLTVPPTLVSFAIAPEHTDHIVSPEFKTAGDAVLLFDLPRDGEGMPDFDTFKQHCDFLHQAVVDGKVKAMHAVGQGGIAAAVAQMAFGNGIGFDIDADFAVQELFNLRYGALLVETDSETAAAWVKRDQVSLVGKTADAANISVAGVKIALSDLQDAWEKPLNQIFPIKDKDGEGDAELPLFTTYGPRRSESFGAPRVFILFARGRTANTTRLLPLNGPVQRRTSWSFATIRRRTWQNRLKKWPNAWLRRRSSCSPAASVPATNRKVPGNSLQPCSATPFCPKPSKASCISATA